MRKKLMHLTDIRLKNNAGITLPVCKAGATLLALDATAMRQTGNFDNVSCPRCKSQALRRYPWAFKKQA